MEYKILKYVTNTKNSLFQRKEGLNVIDEVFTYELTNVSSYATTLVSFTNKRYKTLTIQITRNISRSIQRCIDFLSKIVHTIDPILYIGVGPVYYDLINFLMPLVQCRAINIYTSDTEVVFQLNTELRTFIHYTDLTSDVDNSLKNWHIWCKTTINTLIEFYRSVNKHIIINSRFIIDDMFEIDGYDNSSVVFKRCDNGRLLDLCGGSSSVHIKLSTEIKLPPHGIIAIIMKQIYLPFVVITAHDVWYSYHDIDLNILDYDWTLSDHPDSDVDVYMTWCDELRKNNERVKSIEYDHDLHQLIALAHNVDFMSEPSFSKFDRLFRRNHVLSELMQYDQYLDERYSYLDELNELAVESDPVSEMLDELPLEIKRKQAIILKSAFPLEIKLKLLNSTINNDISL